MCEGIQGYLNLTLLHVKLDLIASNIIIRFHKLGWIYTDDNDTFSYNKTLMKNKTHVDLYA